MRPGGSAQRTAIEITIEIMGLEGYSGAVCRLVCHDAEQRVAAKGPSCIDLDRPNGLAFFRCAVILVVHPGWIDWYDFVLSNNISAVD